MSIIYVLIPLGLLLLAIAVAFFLWAINSGQFDDLDDQGKMVLDDNEREPEANRGPGNQND